MNQPPLNPDALDNLAQVVLGISTEEWNEHDEDEKRQALAPYTRIIETYLAAALPEVTSVEEVPAKLQIISWEEEPEHECWKLAPDETFVGLIVKSGRSWTPRDKYTLNIERPEVKP